MWTHKSRLLILRPDQRKQWGRTPTEQVIKKSKNRNPPFYRHRAVPCKAFCQHSWKCESEAQRDHRRQHICLSGQFLKVHLKKRKDTQRQISPTLKNNLKETSLLWKKKQLTNFGFNTCKYGANIEGKLLSKGTVFGNCYSLPRIIKSLLDTGLLYIIWILFIILSSQKPLLNTNIIYTRRQSHLEYHAIQQLPLQLEQELLKRFQLVFRNGKFPRVMVYRFQ